MFQILLDCNRLLDTRFCFERMAAAAVALLLTPLLCAYPKKQISKEVKVTAYNRVFYPESRYLLRRYSRDKAPSGRF